MNREVFYRYRYWDYDDRGRATFFEFHYGADRHLLEARRDCEPWPVTEAIAYAKARRERPVQYLHWGTSIFEIKGRIPRVS